MSNRALRKLQAGSGLCRKEEEEVEEEVEVVRKGGAASGGFNAFLLVSRKWRIQCLPFGKPLVLDSTPSFW